MQCFSRQQKFIAFPPVGGLVMSAAVTPGGDDDQGRQEAALFHFRYTSEALSHEYYLKLDFYVRRLLGTDCLPD